MSEPNEPQQQLEPPPESPPPDEAAQLRAQLQQVLAEKAQLEARLQPAEPQGDFIQGVAALQASNDPRDQIILGLGQVMSTMEQRLKATEQRVQVGSQIPPERLAAAEAEFKTGRYESLADADAAAYGKAVLSGKAQPRPKPQSVQTVTRSVTPEPSLQDLKEIPASQFREQLKGPQGAELHRRYKAGQLNVVPG